MIIAATGHRPDKLGGYGIDVYERLTQFAKGAIARCDPEQVISGMAMGWDMAVAEAAIQLKVPLVSAIPFKGQHDRWSEFWQERYLELVEQAARVVYVSPGGYAPQKMQARNIWMVDHSDRLMALWNGMPGGTANCINYAISVGKRDAIDNLWPRWVQANEGLA